MSHNRILQFLPHACECSKARRVHDRLCEVKTELETAANHCIEVSIPSIPRLLDGDDPALTVFIHEDCQDSVIPLTTEFNTMAAGVAAELRAAGIACGVHYPTPLHLAPAYAWLNYRSGDLPATERWATEVLSLPIYPGLSRDAQHEVIAALSAAVSTAPHRSRAPVDAAVV